MAASQHYHDAITFHQAFKMVSFIEVRLGKIFVHINWHNSLNHGQIFKIKKKMPFSGECALICPTHVMFGMRQLLEDLEFAIFETHDRMQHIKSTSKSFIKKSPKILMNLAVLPLNWSCILKMPLKRRANNSYLCCCKEMVIIRAIDIFSLQVTLTPVNILTICTATLENKSYL